jgi:hypothetical protein
VLRFERIRPFAAKKKAKRSELAIGHQQCQNDPFHIADEPSMLQLNLRRWPCAMQ